MSSVYEGVPQSEREVNTDLFNHDFPDEDEVLDRDRWYTDVYWLIFAAVMIAGIVTESVFALEYQKASIVNHGMDWRGQKCGEGSLSDAPLKGWLNPLFTDVDAGAVCLKSCPVTSNGGQVSKWGTIMCVCNDKIDADVANKNTPLGKICDTADAKTYGYAFYDGYSSRSTISKYVTYTDSTTIRPCVFQYQMKEIMHMCLPELDDLNYQVIVEQHCGSDSASMCGLTERLSEHVNTSRFVIQRLFRDITDCKWVILVCCICAMIFAASCFFIIQSRSGTLLMLWTNVLWYACLLGTSFWASGYFQDRADTTPTLASRQSDLFSAWLLAFVGWLCVAMFVIQALVSLWFSRQGFSRNEVTNEHVQSFLKDEAPAQDDDVLTTAEVASQTLVLAGRSLTLLPSSMLVSVFVQVITVDILLWLWFLVAFAIMTAGEISTDSYGVSHLTFDSAIQWSGLFHLFFWIWLMEVIDVIVATIAGGVVAVFVFAPTDGGLPDDDDRRMPSNPLWHSFVTMGRFHLGTIIAAATVLMLCRPLHVVVNIIHLLRFGSGVPRSQWDNQKPDLTTCLGQLEHWYHNNIQILVRGTDKRAIVQTVLHGTPFFSARKATWHLNKHYGRYMSVPMFSTSVAMYVTRNNIALSCCFIGQCLIMTETFGVRDMDLQSSLSALIVIFFFGHIIGWAFLSHLDAAVITQLVGFAEAKLRLYTPGVPQLTVPQDLVVLCERAQVHNELKLEEEALNPGSILTQYTSGAIER